MQSSAELVVRADAAVPTRIANQACRIFDEGAAATVLSVQQLCTTSSTRYTARVDASTPRKSLEFNRGQHPQRG